MINQLRLKGVFQALAGFGKRLASDWSSHAFVETRRIYGVLSVVYNEQ